MNKEQQHPLTCRPTKSPGLLKSRCAEVLWDKADFKSYLIFDTASIVSWLHDLEHMAGEVTGAGRGEEWNKDICNHGKRIEGEGGQKRG